MTTKKNWNQMTPKERKTEIARQEALSPEERNAEKAQRRAEWEANLRETTTPCKDCGLMVWEHTLECWKDPHTSDHVDLCCDCFDEKLGAPPSSRTRPRPQGPTG